MSDSRIPLVVIGPGAIGCAVAGAAVQVGHQPVMAARTRFDVLHVTHPEGVIEAPVHCLDGASDATPADLVLLAVKAHQTVDAADWLGALVDSGTTLAVLQNGVEHVERVRSFIDPAADVVPVVVALPADRKQPGRVEVTGRCRLTVPPGPGAEALSEVLAHSFVQVVIADDWLRHAWTKLMLNAASGGICVFSGTDNSIFERDDGVAEQAKAVMREVAEVGRAEGADLAEDLPERILERLAANASGHRSSNVVDRLNGQPSEWDARNAVVPRIAARHGISVPRCELLATLMRVSEPPSRTVG